MKNITELRKTSVPKFDIKKREHLMHFITMLRNPEISSSDRTSWVDALPLTKKGKLAFMIEAQQIYEDALLPHL